MDERSNIYHVFQPIVSTQTLEVIGYEAFLRSHIESNPLALFNKARKEKIISKLDSMSIEQAISQYGYNNFLFLNIFPSTVLDDESYLLLTQLVNYFNENKQIILELNESIDDGLCWEEFELFDRINNLRTLGYLIAIDDVGKGQSSMHKVIELNPDFIKLDRYFAQNLHKCKLKQEVVSFFVNYSKHRSLFILEGIENHVDLSKATELGVNYVQGFLFGQPLTRNQMLSKENCCVLK